MKDYEVWCHDREGMEKASAIEAIGVKTAAKLWAEEWDNQNKDMILDGNKKNVSVKSPNGDIHKFQINGEVVERYYVTEIQEES